MMMKGHSVKESEVISAYWLRLGGYKEGSRGGEVNGLHRHQQVHSISTYLLKTTSLSSQNRMKQSA